MSVEIPTFTMPASLRGDTWPGISSLYLGKNDAPLNLTDASILIQFRKDVDSPVTLELSTDNGRVVILDAENGTFRIPEFLVTTQYGTYKYDLQVTFPDGYTKTYLKGTWQVVSDISHL
jgi:hypothetical protein